MESKTMKQTRTIALLGILIFCLMFPCLIHAGKMWPSSVSEMVAKTKQSINLVNMAAFREVVDKKDYDMIIDVREPDEYATGHIPGAINIPRGVIEFKIWKKVGFPDNTDTGKKIYLYCKTGGRSSLVTKALQDLGFTNVNSVNMKIADWIKAGHPIQK